ncbi:MAG: hypothetical protein R3F49_19395 [Planctomycetota bacterium]
MAKKQSQRTPAPGKQRYRRSDDELIADLKERIAQLKQRADAKKLKTSPSMKRTLTIVRSIDKALEEANEEKNNDLRRILVDARAPIAAFLGEQGVKLPKPRGPRGRKPRGGARG